MARSQEDSSHCNSKLAGTKNSRKMALSKSRKSLETRTRQINEPNTLTEDKFDEHCRDVIATFVKEGLESRCKHKCKKSQNPLKFSLLTVHEKLTHSQQRKWSRNSIDHESSDAVQLKQLRDQMV